MDPDTRWKDAVLPMAAYIAACLVMNGLIFAMGWQDQSTAGRGLLPPGWVIGLVWVGLFGGLGLAHARLTRRHDGGRARRRIIWLAAWCLAYPLYTLGLSSRTIGLLGNLATIAFALVVAASLVRLDRASGALVALIVVWVTYATVGLVPAP